MSGRKMLKPMKLTRDSLFLLGYFVLILNQILSQSQFSEMSTAGLILKASRWMLIVYFAFLILKGGKYPGNKRGLFWAFFVIVSVLEMTLFNGKLLLVILFMLVISSYKVNLDSLIQTHIKALICGLVVVSLSSMAGILEVLGVYKAFDNITGFLFKPDNIRYAFGFINSNVIPITCLYLYLYILLLKKESYKWYYDIFALMFNHVVFLFCGSRVCILLVFFSVGLRWLFSKNEKKYIKFLFILAFFALALCLIFSIALPSSSLYYSEFVAKINVILTARIQILRNVLMKYPITMFGYGEMSINNSVEYLVMDNGYVALFVTRGAIIGVLFISLICSMIWNAKKTNNIYLLLFITIMILANIVDNSILHYITFPLYIMTFGNYEKMNYTRDTEYGQ